MGEVMPYCPKCGNKVDETMTFCPRCGASLSQVAQTPSGGPTYPPAMNEKGEKHEKREKGEKHEKGEFGFIGYLIAGIVIILLGVAGYLNATVFRLSGPLVGFFWLLFIGVIIIIAGILFGTRARRRNPNPPP